MIHRASRLLILGLASVGFFAFMPLSDATADQVFDVTEGSDGHSMFLRIEENSRVSNSPVDRRPTIRQGASSNPEPQAHAHTGSPERYAVESGPITSQAPTRSTICFRGDGDVLTRMHGVYRCNIPAPEDPAPPPEDVPAPVPPAAAPVAVEPVEIVITTSDLLELIPSTPQILMDRGPFGLKNAHTNFYASDHQPQTITRTMFGQNVTITATPVEYRWDYGDGNSLVTETPGRPVDDFNIETETSHQYTEPGFYTVTMTTVFEGTYAVDGGPTQAVSSTVTQQAEPVEIRIWRAVTRNVDQTCEQNSTAWGC